MTELMVYSICSIAGTMLGLITYPYVEPVFKKIDERWTNWKKNKKSKK